MGKENTIQKVNAKGQEESWIGEPEKTDVVQGIKTTVAFLNLRFKIKQQYCTNCLPIHFNILHDVVIVYFSRAKRFRKIRSQGGKGGEVRGDHFTFSLTLLFAPF